jgi:tyrosyl-tRNA synthetase
MFKNRLENEMPIRLHEVMYPLMQGYDSVHMEVDLEVGGSDQTFNMLTGRILARNLKDIEKSVLTLKLLTDNSGTKMGKTTNNAISFKDSPEDVYGKIMSFSDEIVPLAYELLSDKSMKEIEALIERMKVEPMLVKKELAFEITKLIHSSELATKGAENFSNVIQSGEIPEDIDTIEISKLNLSNNSINIVELLSQINATESKGEAKRLILQGGVKLDGEKLSDPLFNLEPQQGSVIQVGKRKWFKLA